MFSTTHQSHVLPPDKYSKVLRQLLLVSPQSPVWSGLSMGPWCCWRGQQGDLRLPQSRVSRKLPLFLYITLSTNVVQSCPTLCNLMDCSTPGFPVLHISWSLLKLMSIESVMPSNHLMFSHPLLFPSIFASIRAFSNELALFIRWPKYWSFSFSISLSSEYSGLKLFRCSANV